MLIWRIGLGALFIAALVGLCWLDYLAPRPGTYLLPLAIALGLLGASELLAIFRKRGHQPLSWAIYSGVVVILLSSAGMPVLMPSAVPKSLVGRLGWMAIGLAASLLIAIIGELRRFQSTGQATVNLALTLFAASYVGGLMGFVVQLRLLSGGPWGIDGRWGMVALISLIATVKLSDVGQYSVGRLVGRRKLAPAISPGKTWEGAIGGIVFAVFASWMVFHWGSTSSDGASIAGVRESDALFRTAMTALFAVAVATAGILGDLAESMLKRDAGVKDSSTWMPGFGGVLDVLDSLLGAAPVAYLFWVMRIVGP
jgi:phosphatidate cytidylyltransferase